MSNITKAFKAKRGLCAASGGVFQPGSFMSTVPDARPTSMFAGQNGEVASSYGGGLGAASRTSSLLPAGQPQQQFGQNRSLMQALGDKINMGNAVGSLSNTQRSQLENPGNQPYKLGGALGSVSTPVGSSAEASQMAQQTSALSDLRKNLAEQPPAMAEGGVIERDRTYAPQTAGIRGLRDGMNFEDGLVPVIQNRNAALSAAANYGNTPAPVATAPAPAPTPAPVGQAADYAAQAAKIEAEQAAAAKARSDAMKPKSTMQRIGAAFGLRDGGTIMPVHGKGTGRSDDVPVVLAGHTVNVSNGEGVAVIPAKTMKNPEAIDQITDAMQGSNDGREPKGLRDDGKYMTGAIGDGIDPRQLRPEFRAAEMVQPIEPAANAGLEQARSNRANIKMNALPDAPVNMNGAQPQGAAPAAQAVQASAPPAAKPVARTPYDLGKSAGQATRTFGGKALSYAIPAAAALDTMGDDGIRVDGVREKADPAEEDAASGMPRALGAAKELALRAGDWGTKGSDMLMNIPLWAANKAGATSDGKPLEYRLLNKTYREGVRGLDGVTAPQSATERENIDPRAAHNAIMASSPSVAPTRPAAAPLTPAQQAQAVNDEGVTNQRAHDNLVSYAQRSAGLRGGESAMTTGNTMLKSIANNDHTRALMNDANDGTGVNYGTRTLSDGRRQTEISGAGMHEQYLGTDGKFTTDGTKGVLYKQQMDQNTKNEALLKKMQDDRYMRDATSIGATEGDRLGLAAGIKRDEVNGANAAKLAGVQMAGLEFNRNLRNDAVAQDNKERDVENTQDQQHQGRVDDLVKSWASGEDGKLNPQQYSFLQKYSGNFAKTKNMTPSQHLKVLQDNYEVDKLIEGQGRHLLTSETPWAGEKTMLKKMTAGAGALAHGALPNQDSFMDPRTNRTIYWNDVARNLSPDQVAILKTRVLDK